MKHQEQFIGVQCPLWWTIDSCQIRCSAYSMLVSFLSWYVWDGYKAIRSFKNGSTLSRFGHLYIISKFLFVFLTVDLREYIKKKVQWNRSKREHLWEPYIERDIWNLLFNLLFLLGQLQKYLINWFWTRAGRKWKNYKYFLSIFYEEQLLLCQLSLQSK